MTHLIAVGNNITGNLDPSNADPVLPITDITEATGCTEVLWHSWACTIGKGSKGLHAWGSVPIQLKELLSAGVDPLSFLGHDHPEAYLGKDGHVYDFDGAQSASKWQDVAITGLDDVYAVLDGSIIRFPSLAEMMKGENGELKGEVRGDRVSLHALDSRCFVKVDSHLFEVKEKLKLIDDLEGLGISVFEGRRNRLGVVTDAGDAYIFETKAAEPALLELDVDEDVRLVRLGSEFDVVVTETKVFARGDNQFRQLGQETPMDGSAEEWVEVDVKGEDVVDVVCSRWATIFTLR